MVLFQPFSPVLLFTGVRILDFIKMCCSNFLVEVVCMELIFDIYISHFSLIPSRMFANKLEDFLILIMYVMNFVLNFVMNFMMNF